MLRKSFIFITLLLCGTSLTEAQINHYRSNEVGARSTMLGGAVVGYVRDNSAIYYNPSGLAYIENSSLSVVGDAISLDYFYQKNGAGSDVNLRSLSAEAVPQIFSGILKSKKNPILTINYAIINIMASRNSLFAKSSGSYDVFNSRPGLEDYSGVFEYYNSTREDWFGVGWGYKLYERLGIGFSLFLSVRSQTHSESIDVGIVEQSIETNPSNLLGSNSYYNSVYYLNLAFIGKFGLSYEFDKIKLGANLTLPRSTFASLSNSTINRSTNLQIPSDSISVMRRFAQDKISNAYKSPLSIDLGFKYLINSKNYVYFSSAYYGKIDKYNILKTEVLESEADKILAPDNENLYSVNEANKRVINLGVGVEHVLNEELMLLLGFTTDFNYLDFSVIDLKDDFVPSNNTFNLYHFSGGVDWTMEKFHLNLGIRTSFGHSYDTEQFVNLTSPTVENYFLGDIENNVKTDFFRVTAVIGFTYFFSRF